MVLESDKVWKGQRQKQEAALRDGLNFRRFKPIEKVANDQIFVALIATIGRSYAGQTGAGPVCARWLAVNEGGSQLGGVKARLGGTDRWPE